MLLFLTTNMAAVTSCANQHWPFFQSCGSSKQKHIVKRSDIEEHWVHYDKRKTREENVSSTFPRKKLVIAKKALTNRWTKSEFTSHFEIAAKTSLLLLFPTRYAQARYSSRMIDKFLNWGDHGKPKSGIIKGRCQPPHPESLLPALRLHRAGRREPWERG